MEFCKPRVIFSALLIAAVNVHAAEPDISDFRDVKNPSIALTPTRMGQALNNIPGTVTVLLAEDLLKKNVTTVPEALRLVPGISQVEVTGFSQTTGHDYRIGYHGGSALVPRGIQFIVDGRVQYIGALSKIDWSNCPALVADIERIEVTMNPSAASYGSNSFRAVVHVFTRHSGDIPQYEFNADTDSRKGHLLSYRSGYSVGNNSFSIALSQWRDNGYDSGTSTITGADTAPDHRDDSEVNRIIFRSDNILNGNTELTIHAGAVLGDYEAEYVVGGQEPGIFPDIRTKDYFASGSFRYAHSARSETRMQISWKKNELKQDFRACSPAVFIFPEAHAMFDANPEYFSTLLAGGLPSGGSREDDLLALALLTRVQSVGAVSFTNVCGTLNQDYIDLRSDLTIEHHAYLTNNLRWIVGGTYEHLEGTSETLFSGWVKQKVGSLFASMEWQANQKFTVNAGLMAEHPENLGKFIFSPRASVNFHYKDNLTFRIVGNRAFRTPDDAEAKREQDYRVINIDPVVDGITDSIFAGHASSEGFNLRAEQIDALEVGVLYHARAQTLTLNARGFYEELDHLISEKPAYSNFHLTNNGKGRVHGFDSSLQAEISTQFDFELGYSYLDTQFNSLNEEGFNKRHSGRAELIFNNIERTISFAYMGNSKQMNKSFDRWSLSWVEKITDDMLQLNVSMLLQYQPSAIVYAEDDIGLRNQYEYDNDFYAKIGLTVTF